MTPPFLFIRHGETDWNVAGRLQGTRDIGLNRRGRRQARDAAAHLEGFLQRRGLAAADIAFVASPLARARDTAAGVRDALGLDPAGYAVDARLQELSFGLWEGLTWPDIKAREPQLYRARRQDKWSFVPPGGESYAMLADRIRPWLDGVREGLVVVSHGGVARVLMVLLGGLSAATAPEADIPQGRVLRFADRGFAWL